MFDKCLGKLKGSVMAMDLMEAVNFWELVVRAANFQELVMWAVGQGVIHMWCWSGCIN